MGDERKRIALIGTTGVGKSSLANILTGIDPWVEDHPRSFEVGADATSCTLDVDAKDGYWLGDRSKPIRIQDTPGHGDGQGHDNKLKRRLVAGMKREQQVHVFVWVKNSQSPRFDDLDKQFYEIFGEMFGQGFVSHMVVVFTRFKHSTEAERIRQRTRSSLEKTIDGFRQSIGDVRGIVPMFAIDAYYDKENPQEAEMFHKACSEMWTVIQRFGRMPMEHVEVVKDRMAVLTEQIVHLNEQISSMRGEHRSEMRRLKKQLEEDEERQTELEEQLERQQSSSSSCAIL